MWPATTFSLARGSIHENIQIWNIFEIVTVDATAILNHDLLPFTPEGMALRYTRPSRSGPIQINCPPLLLTNALHTLCSHRSQPSPIDIFRYIHHAGHHFLYGLHQLIWRSVWTDFSQSLQYYLPECNNLWNLIDFFTKSKISNGRSFYFDWALLLKYCKM